MQRGFDLRAGEDAHGGILERGNGVVLPQLGGGDEFILCVLEVEDEGLGGVGQLEGEGMDGPVYLEGFVAQGEGAAAAEEGELGRGEVGFFRDLAEGGGEGGAVGRLD